ncbi:hypothetical protein M569_15332, partial [Genlisea aurea]
VLTKIRNYLELIGRRIDEIVSDYKQESYRQERMTTRLWNYVSTFSNLSGEGLQQIYSKLKEEQQQAGSSFNNGPALDVGKFEAWKRRKRAESEASQLQQYSSYQKPPPLNNNGTWLPDSGILGPPPSGGRQFGNGRPYRMQQQQQQQQQQPGFSSRQGFSSGVK